MAGRASNSNFLKAATAVEGSNKRPPSRELSETSSKGSENHRAPSPLADARSESSRSGVSIGGRSTTPGVSYSDGPRLGVRIYEPTESSEEEDLREIEEHCKKQALIREENKKKSIASEKAARSTKATGSNHKHKKVKRVQQPDNEGSGIHIQRPHGVANRVEMEDGTYFMNQGVDKEKGTPGYHGAIPSEFDPVNRADCGWQANLKLKEMAKGESRDDQIKRVCTCNQRH